LYVILIKKIIGITLRYTRLRLRLRRALPAVAKAMAGRQGDRIVNFFL